MRNKFFLVDVDHKMFDVPKLSAIVVDDPVHVCHVVMNEMLECRMGRIRRNSDFCYDVVHCVANAGLFLLAHTCLKQTN